ncbi:amino-acid N-acetyltransferase [Mannheimia varigena]|uniref:amino-acid N-acetyltransferase n=1 Tax=Mannheimia varigena TaxID=85404 RepID=UPI0003E34F14|nr:amino-acid N-acetyltransferase [Mannheimia varigena]AHG77607.1 Amino-acid acetyltransferase [Mannheimia varigena USDA-ARS-USMARC-1312]AWW34678.1 amino-acid N-acetyltransferase [Mannheimia varigena]MDY2947997.1 amino-acid N-acetyltransferase [Mannheimia varigena]QLB16316.1 amino-acid N-acetyltransferase [Mannheimia varigena]QLD33054.1 amino-acid N-acetyltransferase [Mannheimia varigena]
MHNTELALAQWFRQSTPYVNMHRGKTFVIMLDGDVIESSNFVNIINDISLLHSLNIKLVIVFGARPQINQLLTQNNIEPEYYNNIRITNPQSLEYVKQAVGKVHYDLFARLSLRLPHSEVINVVSGNMILAQPIGVVDGVDYALSGKIRRINVESIKQQLAQNSIVLLGPIAPSVTGEMFNLPFEDIATQVSIKLRADKLIGFCEEQGILDETGNVISDILPQDAQKVLNNLIEQGQYHTAKARFLHAAISVCREGVKRSHLLSYKADGSLLQELFSRDGIGTQFSMESSENIRIANSSDIPGLLDLIRPLEQQGILVKRSREQLEMEIANYTIIERDGVVIACAALNVYPEEKMAEMACVAVHPDYRDSSRGDILLENIRKRAEQLGIEKLFVLTTRTTQWFQERGFRLADAQDLPSYKRENYNYQRRSKVLILPL